MKRIRLMITSIFVATLVGVLVLYALDFGYTKYTSHLVDVDISAVPMRCLVVESQVFYGIRGDGFWGAIAAAGAEKNVVCESYEPINKIVFHILSSL